MATYIYIDDTGTAQTRSTFVYDTSKSSSWCAIMLNDEHYCNAIDFMNVKLEQLNSFVGLNEFHFTEIFSGKGVYRKNKISFEERMGIFQDFAIFSQENQFPVFIQSFGEDGYSRLKLRRKDLIKIGGFDLNDYKDMALFTLLIQVKRFLFSHPEYSAPYKIVIDEGRKPNGAVQPCVMFGDLLQDEQILYESSAYDVLLQIADFVAFTLNRCTWLNMKETLKVNDYDIRFLKMAADANFNAPNLVKRVIPANCDRSKIYKELLDSAYRKNDRLPVVSVEEFILEMIENIKKNQH